MMPRSPDPTHRSDTPLTTDPKSGFLPLYTNLFDRVFISIVCFIAIHLLWMRFLEASFSLWIATILSIILGFIIVRWG